MTSSLFRPPDFGVEFFKSYYALLGVHGTYSQQTCTLGLSQIRPETAEYNQAAPRNSVLFDKIIHLPVS